MTQILQLSGPLPSLPEFQKGIRRAPFRRLNLKPQDYKLALKNALRYVATEHHAALAPEFLHELKTHGRIYGYRFRPQGRLCGKPVKEYSGKCLAGRALQVMIDNNLDFEIALYPYELVTYGETGQVCQNWMQYQLIKKYLEQLTEEQTLVLHSGHPLGLFRSDPRAPRVITTNGLMVGMFDNTEDWQRAAALGVANYGQMTAGGWMYIGPQGIVHGTFNTLMIAGRLKLGLRENENLSGKIFVSSGLGGMSGAQGKAAMIAGAAAIIAEVDESRIRTRLDQGWVSQIAKTPAEAFEATKKAVSAGQPIAVAYLGNIVDLLEFAVGTKQKIDLLSDQTSCHAAYEGGYCPQGMSFAERTKMLKENPAKFQQAVNLSLKKHYDYIFALTQRGVYFFDYGNAFMKAVFDAGVKSISRNGQDEKDGFIWPSYVEDILGPELFDFGYGPFRWVCLSGEEKDLQKTDAIAAETIKSLRKNMRYQDRDNLQWIEDAAKNRLVVGTKARILYQDALGRRTIAQRFNEAVRNKDIGPIMLGRDHHDTGGTDSPFRETSNIKDGSNVMADMATQCFAGNAARGMTLVALHNGGGVGIGKAINGGFGLLLDGSQQADHVIETAIPWDVLGGVARRAWAGNPNAISALSEDDHANICTLPYLADDQLIDSLVEESSSCLPNR